MLIAKEDINVLEYQRMNGSIVLSAPVRQYRHAGCLIDVSILSTRPSSSGILPNNKQRPEFKNKETRVNSTVQGSRHRNTSLEVEYFMNSSTARQIATDGKMENTGKSCQHTTRNKVPAYMASQTRNPTNKNETLLSLRQSLPESLEDDASLGVRDNVVLNRVGQEIRSRDGSFEGMRVYMIRHAWDWAVIKLQDKIEAPLAAQPVGSLNAYSSKLRQRLTDDT
ncbi:hypothetical protein FB446DRAFT_709052 [Lentinula raphanica]|nr:hypothetical protein FB446DRAFT_709052 [Lentinula raphanica]